MLLLLFIGKVRLPSAQVAIITSRRALVVLCSPILSYQFGGTGVVLAVKTYAPNSKLDLF